jgi:hypothetical protein
MKNKLKYSFETRSRESDDRCLNSYSLTYPKLKWVNSGGKMIVKSTEILNTRVDIKNSLGK